VSVDQPTRDSGHLTTDGQDFHPSDTSHNMVLHDVGKVISVDGLVWVRAVVLCQNTKVNSASLVVIGG
jgi:hypothetical protein